jgi:hypothetical protein
VGNNHIISFLDEWNIPRYVPIVSELQLVGGFKHLDYFPFHIWDVILPIDEVHHFSRWFLTTNQSIIYHIPSGKLT